MTKSKPRSPPASGTTDCDSTARTRALWQSRTQRSLTTEDAREISRNMAGFFSVLLEWANAERKANSLAINHDKAKEARAD